MFSDGQNTTCVNRWVSLYQGCILSGILFSVCTCVLLCNGKDMSLFKYADDMALVSHMRNSNVQAQPVEQVQAFRYLDIDLVFSQHSDTTYKKKKQTTYSPARRTFQVSKDVLTSVYRSPVESVLTFNTSTWFNNKVTIKHKTRLSRIVNHTSKIIGYPDSAYLSSTAAQWSLSKGGLITEDPLHLLHHSIQLRPSGRCFSVPLAGWSIYKIFFILWAISNSTAQIRIATTAQDNFRKCCVVQNKMFQMRE